MTKCLHIHVIFTFSEDGSIVTSRRCSKTFGCGALLPLGLTNDGSTNVQEEIEAAEYDTDRDYLDGAFLSGWVAHYSNWCPEHASVSWRAGWLAREMFTHRVRDQRDSSAWPWDPTRPVAGQYEEWLIREQMRQDVAEAVARHAELELVPVDLIVGDEPERGVEFKVTVGAEP